MGKLKYLIWHCTATPEGRAVSSNDIRKWHIEGRGWSRVGYSDMIHINGELENMIPFNQDQVVDSWEISNGAKGFNGSSRHAVYVGGCKSYKPFWLKFYPAKDTRTEEQKETMLVYTKYMIARHPNILVGGHNQLSNKACPSFDVSRWLRENGIPERNILKL